MKYYRQLIISILAWGLVFQLGVVAWVPVASADQLPVQDYPECIDYSPRGEAVDEKNLLTRQIEGVTHYFIRLTFQGQGNLRLSQDALQRIRSTCHIYSEGGSQTSMIDDELLVRMEQNPDILSYLFKLDSYAYLYIPIKSLRSQTSYQVYIGPGIIEDENGHGNQAQVWSFTTLANPIVTGLSPASLGEDYDYWEPVRIYGDFFADSVEVRFFTDGKDRGEEAYKVKVADEDGNPFEDIDQRRYLKAYLPRKERLEPGLYHVEVANSDHHRQVLYNALSIVETSSLPVPGDLVRERRADRYGEVQETVLLSRDTLKLSDIGRDRDWLRLDLDKLLGRDTWESHIILKQDAYLGELEITSNGADLNFYGVKAWAGTGDPVLTIGHGAPGDIPALIGKLGVFKTCSSFLEVKGENVDIDLLKVRLPFLAPPGADLQVLRFDDKRRIWFDQAFRIDWLNSQVVFDSRIPGIFIVVEQPPGWGK